MWSLLTESGIVIHFLRFESIVIQLTKLFACSVRSLWKFQTYLSSSCTYDRSNLMCHQLKSEIWKTHTHRLQWLPIIIFHEYESFRNQSSNATYTQCWPTNGSAAHLHIDCQNCIIAWADKKWNQLWNQYNLHELITLYSVKKTHFDFETFNFGKYFG